MQSLRLGNLGKKANSFSNEEVNRERNRYLCAISFCPFRHSIPLDEGDFQLLCQWYVLVLHTFNHEYCPFDTSSTRVFTNATNAKLESRAPLSANTFHMLHEVWQRCPIYTICCLSRSSTIHGLTEEFDLQGCASEGFIHGSTRISQN